MQRRVCSRGQDQRGQEAGRRENGNGLARCVLGATRGPLPRIPGRAARWRCGAAGPGRPTGSRERGARGGGQVGWGRGSEGGGARDPRRGAGRLSRRGSGARGWGHQRRVAGARASQVLGRETPRAAVHLPGGGAKTWLAPPGLGTRGSVTKLIAPEGQLCTWPPRPGGSGRRVRASRRLQKSYRNVIKKHGRASVWVKRLISSQSKKGTLLLVPA